MLSELGIMMWIIIGFVVIFGIIMIYSFFKFQNEIKKVSPEYVVELIKEKRSSEDVALAIHYNDEKWVSINEQIPLPLASTVKIIVAIEFAQQAADQKIDPLQKVPLKRLDTFNIPKTDGGAHKAWLDALKADKQVTDVPLHEVAKGMIQFSSNANTDYLIEILGLDNINQVPERLGIEDHDPLFPVVSSMYIPVQLMQDKNLTPQTLVITMDKLSDEEYRQMAIDIHNKWIEQPLTSLEKRKLTKTLNMAVQRAWSERLPRATAEGYISIMDKINSKKYFSQSVHNHLDPLLENPKNKEKFLYAGQKGGSTSFSVTMAMYATDKEHNQTSLALFTNRLNSIEQVKLSRSVNDFQRKFLTDEAFRSHVKEELKEPPSDEADISSLEEGNEAEEMERKSRIQKLIDETEVKD